MSRKIGNPIRFDNNTFNGDFGHYARVLIDVDLSKNIKEVLQLDCGTNIFDVKVVPENIPHFCSACSNIGHTSNDCRMIRRMVKVAKVTDESKIDKADLAIKDRFEAHKNQRKGNKGSLHTPQKLDESSEDSKNEGIDEVDPVNGSKSPSVSPTKGDNGPHTSNKFAALDNGKNTEEKEDGIENNMEQKSGIDEVRDDDKEQRDTQREEDANHKLNNIRNWAEQEKRNMLKQDEAKKKWSDMIEEDEEEESGASKSSPPLAPRKHDTLYYERNGELAELQISTGIVRFSPIKKKKEGK